jgi:CBS-domain-containing membrane protein
MSIIDEQFKDHKIHYILQCLLATISLFVVLVFLDVVKESAIITALGASSFIVFAMPHRYSAQNKRILGGYLVGLIIGFIFYNISTTTLLHVILTSKFIIIFSAASSVGLSIFFMVLFNIEHAPACGVALGLVINEWTIETIVFILIAVLWIIVIKTMARKWFIDLT